MKKKAIVSVLACIMVMAAIGIGNAASTPPNYTCMISIVGAAVWGYYVIATNTDPGAAFADRFFLIDQSTPNKGQAMYATALSAFANSNSVILELYNPNPGGLITILSISK